MRTMFRVSNLIDDGSQIIPLRSISMLILIYCEKRGLHLLMEGADVIQEMARQLLWEMQCFNVPEIVSPHAKVRIDKWVNTMLISSSKFSISGQKLLHQLARTVNKLTDSTRIASSETRGRSLYQPLVKVLNGRNIALKSPSSHDHISW